MKPLKQKVNICLDDIIIQELKTMAEKSDRSLSSFINLILRDYLKRSKEEE